jgi:hypothetical protein
VLVRALLLVGPGLLVLSGCGSSENEVATTSEATTASSVLPEDLVGSYARTLTEGELREAGVSLDGPPEGLPVGRTRLTIEPDGVAFVVHADSGDETINLVATLDRVEVTGGSYCEDPSASANYRWKVTDEELTITPKDVDCPDHQVVLTGTWTRE